MMNEYCFIRHAEAVSQGEDEKRPLSEMGKNQAQLFASEISISFDLIISSSAKRAIETAEIIKKKKHIQCPIEIIQELYLPNNEVDKKDVLCMLNDLGPISLDCFIKQDRTGAWKRYIEAAHDELKKMMGKHAAWSSLIVAHANIINALGLKIVPNAKELLYSYFDNCKGFLVCRGNLVNFI